MQSVLIVVHLMIVIALVVTVLLQRSEGGAIGIGGGGGFMTGRGQANALTRATAILAALFFATSLGLTILARFTQGSEVTFQSFTPIEPGKGPAKEGDGKGSLLDQLQKMEDQASKPSLPPDMTLPGQNGPARRNPATACWKQNPPRPRVRLCRCPWRLPPPWFRLRRAKPRRALRLQPPLCRSRLATILCPGENDNGRNNLRVYV